VKKNRRTVKFARFACEDFKYNILVEKFRCVVENYFGTILKNYFEFVQNTF